VSNGPPCACTGPSPASAKPATAPAWPWSAPSLSTGHPKSGHSSVSPGWPPPTVVNEHTDAGSLVRTKTHPSYHDMLIKLRRVLIAAEYVRMPCILFGVGMTCGLHDIRRR